MTLNTKRTLYFAGAVCSLVIGVLVTAPFYFHGFGNVPLDSFAGYDVKNYWPFAYEGTGADLNDIAIWFSLAAPLILPATCITGSLLYFRNGRRPEILVTTAVCLLIATAFFLRWREIIEWHLD